MGTVRSPRASGYPAVAGEVGLEWLVPGGSNQRRATLAAQVVWATWEQGLASRADQPGAQEPCVPQPTCLEVVRHGKPHMAGGRREQRRALGCPPRGRGPRLPLGTRALPARARGRARKAALRTPLCMLPQLGRGALLARPGGVARAAEAGGACPPRPVVAGLAVPGLGTADHGRQRRPPPRHWIGRQAPPADRRGCGPWPRAAGC
jgi:hypothetical protein